MPADEYEPLRALWRAKQAWERAGRPGDQPQLSLFGKDRFAPPERVCGERKDRPRKRRR
jgi:hypothetical protein